MALLFVSSPHWRLLDLAFPLWSPVQPIENSIGAAGLYLVVIVVLTSYYRRWLGRKQWKRFHFLIYVAAACIFAHSILADPQLAHHRVDFFDGEKLLVEVCLLIVLLASGWAWGYRARKRRNEGKVGSRPATSVAWD